MFVLLELLALVWHRYGMVTFSSVVLIRFLNLNVNGVVVVILQLLLRLESRESFGIFFPYRCVVMRV